MKTEFTGKTMTRENVALALAMAGHVNQEYAEALLRQAHSECPEAVDIIIKEMRRDGLKVPDNIEDLGPEPEDEPNLWTEILDLLTGRS